MNEFLRTNIKAETAQGVAAETLKETAAYRKQEKHVQKVLAACSAVMIAFLCIIIIGIETRADGENIVFLGNSWTEGWGAGVYYSSDSYYYNLMQQGRYSRFMASALGMTEYNFALGGAGFVVDNVIDWMPAGNNYARQISQARANMSTDAKLNTRIVIIMGGWNDAENCSWLTYDNYLARVDEAATGALAEFPNAIVVVAISQSSCNAYYNFTGPADWAGWNQRVLSELEVRHAADVFTDIDSEGNETITPRLCTMPEIINMLGQDTRYYLKEGIHPNYEGHRKLAQQMLDALVAHGVIEGYDSREVGGELNHIRGDVNGDGNVTPLDYVIIKKQILGEYFIPDVKTLYYADLTVDGYLTPLDYVHVKKIIMG